MNDGNSTHTMKNTMIAKELLKHTDLSPADWARLALEAIELLEERAKNISRDELISLLRRSIRAGISAVRAAERTVSLETAAWASVSARQNLRPTTLRDLRHYVRRILRVKGAADLPLRSISSAQCRKIPEQAFANSPSSYTKGRVILHSIFAYGIRLKSDDFNREEQQVIIRPRTSKTGGGRVVPLRGVRSIRKKHRIIPRNWQRRWHALLCAAGFRGKWSPDTCRHTFASYHAAYFRNLPELQLEMGHRDASLLRSRYMMPTLHKDAALFWNGIH